MNVTEERIKVLNAHRRSNVSMKVTDKVEADNKPAGTRVEIRIPLH